MLARRMYLLLTTLTLAMLGGSVSPMAHAETSVTDYDAKMTWLIKNSSKVIEDNEAMTVYMLINPKTRANIKKAVVMKSGFYLLPKKIPGTDICALVYKVDPKNPSSLIETQRQIGCSNHGCGGECQILRGSACDCDATDADDDPYADTTC